MSRPQSSGDVQRLLADSIVAVKAGLMDPAIGNAIALLATALLRAFEIAKATEQRSED